MVREFTTKHPLTVHSKPAGPSSSGTGKRPSDQSGVSSDTATGGGKGRRGSSSGAGPPGGGSSSAGGAAAGGAAGAGPAGVKGPGTAGNDLTDWDQKIKFLEAAISEAKDANISVNKVGQHGCNFVWGADVGMYAEGGQGEMGVTWHAHACLEDLRTKGKPPPALVFDMKSSAGQEAAKGAASTDSCCRGCEGA